MSSISIEEQLGLLDISIQGFIECINTLPDFLFLRKIDDWTPRDITAHLIGWNLYTIKGCQQLAKGEIPFYLVDPGDDYCKVNAVLVKQHNSRERKRLITRLNSSQEKLSKFLLTVAPADWGKDFGVKYKGETITIKNSVDALIEEYINHRHQIERKVPEQR